MKGDQSEDGNLVYEKKGIYVPVKAHWDVVHVTTRKIFVGSKRNSGASWSLVGIVQRFRENCTKL